MEILLPRAFYDRLEALRAQHTPGLTLPNFIAQVLAPEADGFEAAMADVERAGRLVVEP